MAARFPHMQWWLVRHRRFRLAQLLALVLGLLAAEVGYRGVVLARFQWQARYFYSDLWVAQYNHPTIFSMRPGSKGKLALLVNHDQSFDYVINEAGLRGPLPESKNPEDKVLLAFLGDSMPFGWGVTPEQSYPFLVERIINERAGYEAVDVLNAGVPGYNTEQTYYQFRDVVEPAYDVDIAMLSYLVNDAEPQAAIPSPPSEMYRFAWSWLLARINGEINRKIAPKAPLLFPTVNVHTYEYIGGFRDRSPKWRVSHRALGDLADLCRDADIGLIVGVVPDFFLEFDDTYPWVPIHKAVMQWCEEFGIPGFDLLPPNRGLTREQYLLPGDTHPNVWMHARMAEQIADQILMHWEALAPGHLRPAEPSGRSGFTPDDSSNKDEQD